MLPLGSSRRNIAIRLCVEELEWCISAIVKKWKICLLVSTQYTNVTGTETDGRTDTGRRHTPRLYIALRYKIYMFCD